MMKEHLTQLTRDFVNVHMYVCYSDPSDEDVQGKDYDHRGHIDLQLLRNVLPSNNYEYYICGPPPMMGTLTKDLESWGVPNNKIHFESFGPASVKRVTPSSETTESPSKISVTFAKSGKTVDWDSQVGSLLDFSEAHGVIPDSGCRAGSCGTCVTAIKSGEVDYLTDPGTAPEAGSCLICIAVPKNNVMLDL